MTSDNENESINWEATACTYTCREVKRGLSGIDSLVRLPPTRRARRIGSLSWLEKLIRRCRWREVREKADDRPWGARRESNAPGAFTGTLSGEPSQQVKPKKTYKKESPTTNGTKRQRLDEQKTER